MVKFKQVRHLSIAIERTPQDVYAYAGNPENMPAWAAGLGHGISRTGADWEVHTAQGRLKMRFAPSNDLGVLDHTVVLPDGAEVYVPLRVLANGAGSEVVFTLYRQPEMDDAAFARDAGMVENDLASLKALLEK
ncbi:MAG TPA: SRPBCC family protein [Burkholderiales bacterium]|jgi:hypothetical protein|nr:SRPBCC family protein [Burkholderiales bacterium]